MKMVLMSSACAIVVGIGAYYILMSTGMDTANVMSSINVVSFHPPIGWLGCPSISMFPLI